MAGSFSWTLISPPPASGGLGGAGLVTTVAAPFLACPFDAYTQQDLLDMFERILPQHYIEPLKNPGPGYEVLQAAAAVGARISLAVARFACGAYILSSTGGDFSVGEVELYRDAENEEGIDVTVKAGTIVKSSRGGRSFYTTEDVVFPAAAFGPYTVPIRAVAQGFAYNVTGQVVGLDGTVLDGEIDSIDELIEEPDVGDITIRVRQFASTSGGVDATLDQHGLDRNLPRNPGELDGPYRARVTGLPDNISPNAIERAMQQALYPLGVTYTFVETFEMGYQTCWDGPPYSIPGSPYDPNLCCYDDPRSPLLFRNRWLSENDLRGAFVVAVPAIGPLNDVGMAYDDVALNAGQLTNSLGIRAVGAYDVPSDLAFGYRQGCWDGYDLLRASTMKTLYDTLQSLKAAGISAALELQGA